MCILRYKYMKMTKIYYQCKYQNGRNIYLKDKDISDTLVGKHALWIMMINETLK